MLDRASGLLVLVRLFQVGGQESAPYFVTANMKFATGPWLSRVKSKLHTTHWVLSISTYTDRSAYRHMRCTSMCACDMPVICPAYCKCMWKLPYSPNKFFFCFLWKGYTCLVGSGFLNADHCYEVDASARCSFKLHCMTCVQAGSSSCKQLRTPDLCNHSYRYVHTCSTFCCSGGSRLRPRRRQRRRLQQPRDASHRQQTLVHMQ